MSRGVGLGRCTRVAVAVLAALASSGVTDGAQAAEPRSSAGGDAAGAVHTSTAAPRRALELAPGPRAFQAADWVAGGVLGGSVLATYLLLGPVEGGPRGGWLFDDDARGWLRAEARSGREAAKLGSDVGQWLLFAHPFVVDAGLVSWALRGDPDLALRLALVDAEAFLVSLLVTQLTKDLVGRERPYADGCAPGACTSDSRRQSFVSGHTTTAFTGAALVCLHHTELPLYGGGAPDVAACAAGLGLASTVAVLRVAADDHWATDVLAGAAVGLLSGWLLPKLLYYGTGVLEDSGRAGGSGRSASSAGPTVIPLPDVGVDHLGLTLLFVP